MPRPDRTPTPARRRVPMGDGMGVTVQVKIVLATIFVFVSYVTWVAFADGREAQRLADLGPCGLAQAYVGWRFESGDGASGAEGTDVDEARRDAFANAARLVDATSAPSDQAALVDRLRALTSQEADPSRSAPENTDAFLDAFGEACPVEYRESTGRFGD
ncbi:MAG: hypothetical protein ABR510_13105 [Trueperaceae bacterium]